ncbi:MAG: DUF2238 domain-containing protein [Phycisphaerales bacterium]|nr:DUF2238 domain-containing protein [Planctomycetota bacterium]MCH8508398.1 DUF2238 domain-containing protein [Phycisphaerales bacterium]
MVELRRRRSLPPGIVFFTASYMVVCSAMALRQGNLEFLAYAGSMVVFIAIVLALHTHARFNNATLWMLSAWGALHMLGGTVPIPEAYAEAEGPRAVLYTLRLHPWLPRYDQIVHFYGFFAATFAAWEALRRALHARPGLGLCIAAALIGMGLGALNETLEFFITRVIEDHGVGGYENTGWDLVANAAGAITAGVLLLNRTK